MIDDIDSPASSATADAGTSPEVTQASDTGNGTTPSNTGSATADTPAAVADTTGSLPTDKRSSTPNLANAPATATGDSATTAQADPYEKRWKDATAWATKLSQENKRHQEQLKAWDGLDPHQVRESLERQQQQAEAARLKPWNARHPEFGSTQNRLNRVRGYFQSAEAIEADPNVTSEAKQSMLARMAQKMGVTREDAKLYQDFESDKESIQERLATDFDGLFQERFEAHFQQRMSDYEQFQQARTKTESILSGNQGLIDKRRDEILWAMQNPQRSEVALALAQAREELESLKARVGQQSEHVETAQAQSAALKQRASITRDAQTRTPATDPVAEAAKLNLRGSALAEFMMRQRQS